MIISKFFKNFVKSEIKNKIITYSVTLLFLNMVIIGVISYFISSSSIMERISTANIEILNQSVGSIDFILKSIENSAMQEFDGLNLSEQLDKARNGNAADEQEVDKAIKNVINRVLNLRNEIDYVYVIGNDYMQGTQKGLYSNEAYARLQVINEKQFETLLENQGDSFVWTYVVKEGLEIGALRKVALCRAILDSQNRYRGFILLMLREGVFEDVYSNLSKEDRQVYLVNQEDMVVSAADKGAIGQPFPNKFSSVGVDTTGVKELDNRKYVVSSAISQYTGWRLYMVEPQENVISTMGTVKWWLGASVLTCILVFIALSIFLGNVLTKPIKKLKERVSSVSVGENTIEDFNPNAYARARSRGTHRKGLKFRTKIFIMFLVIIIIPVMVLMTVTYYASYDVVKKKSSEINRLYAKQTRIKVEYYLSSFEKSIYDLYAETRLNGILRQRSLDKDESRIKDEDKKLVDDVLIKMIDKNREIMYVQLMDAENRLVTNLGTNKQIIPESIYNKVNDFDETKNIWYGPYVNYFKQNVLTLGKKIKDMNDFITTGYIFTSLKEADLEKVYRNYDETQNASFIVDDAGFIVSHPNKNFLNTKAAPVFAELIDKGEQEVIKEIDGESKMVSLDTIRNSGWKVVHISSMGAVTKNMNQMLIYYIAVLFLTSVSIAAITFKVSRKIGRPLNDLSMRVSKFADGELSFEAEEVATGDEIEQLNNSFNSMMQRIKSLIEEVYEAKIRKHEAELNGKEAELTLLQAQINPHFLYNTLEIIRWKAMFLTNGENEVTEIVSTLSDFFRLSLSKGKKIVTLKDEIEHAINYVTIMNYRYNNKIVVEWKIDSSLHDCKVPKIILQPLIENAIYHGIKAKPGQGIIEVLSEKRGNSIELEVRDNGDGISAENLERLNAILAGTESSEVGGYGLRNVNQRIKLVFGENYGLKINSIQGYGTSVYISLPISWIVGQ